MRIGSLFSGIGGLDLAAEWALGGSTAWQLDLVGAAVRARHWPDALQVEADVADVDADDLPAVEVLVGGFSCQDLSCAGTGAGLVEGTRTGPAYRGLLRFAGARFDGDGAWSPDPHRRWLPDLVVMENVPALLSRWRPMLEEQWPRLGYGLTWVKAMALDAGAPHLRRRVFVLAERGCWGRGVVEVPTGGGWTPERDERTWGTPRNGNGGVGHDTEATRGRLEDEVMVRPWPTTDHKASGAEGYSTESGRHSGTTLTDAVVRTWATPAARDYKNGQLPRKGSDVLPVQASRTGKRLSPAWVEVLQGYPIGWTLPEGPRLGAERDPRWPRGRYPEGWDRSLLWPGYSWEPARTLPDGPPAKGRPARLKALGNAVVPQQGALAIQAGLAPAQVALFG